MSENKIGRRGTMFVFSAPSGGGKSSVIKELMQNVEDLAHSVSVTTRQMRPGEEEGKDYYFVSEEKFKELVKENALYEYVDSDFGPKYGTPKAPVDKLLAEGKDVILDLDYPGVQQLRALAGDCVKAICFIPPSIKVLRERLVNRGTDTPEVIEKRMSMATKRIRESAFYDYVVVNDVLSDAVAEAAAIIRATRVEKKNLCGLDTFIEQVLEK